MVELQLTARELVALDKTKDKILAESDPISMSTKDDGLYPEFPWGDPPDMCHLITRFCAYNCLA